MTPYNTSLFIYLFNNINPSHIKQIYTGLLINFKSKQENSKDIKKDINTQHRILKKSLVTRGKATLTHVWRPSLMTQNILITYIASKSNPSFSHSCIIIVSLFFPLLSMHVWVV